MRSTILREKAPLEAPSDLISRVCRERSITVDAFRGRDSSHWVSDARREVAATLRARGMPYSTIARFVGRHENSVRGLLGV